MKRSARPSIAVAAFEPFGGRRTNASLEAARIACDALSLPLTVLPVRFSALSKEITLLLRPRPKTLLLLGEAWRAEKLRIERVAVNLIDARLPDNGGAQPRDVPVIRNAPPAYFVTVEPKRLVAEAKRAAPTELSLSAGAFACNAALFHALHRAEETRVGFVHVPASPKAMSRERIAKAVVRILEALE